MAILENSHLQLDGSQDDPFVELVPFAEAFDELVHNESIEVSV